MVGGVGLIRTVVADNERRHAVVSSLAGRLISESRLRLMCRLSRYLSARAGWLVCSEEIIRVHPCVCSVCTGSFHVATCIVLASLVSLSWTGHMPCHALCYASVPPPPQCEMHCAPYLVSVLLC
jgi:hypothetical protein